MSEVIKLEYPIEVDGIETDTLHLRRPKVRDIKLMDAHKGDVNKSIHFLAALCGVAPAAIEELDSLDFERVSKKVEGFTKSDGKTSGSSAAESPAPSTRALPS